MSTVARDGRTQVVVVGAGPAGMLLAHLLAARGVDTVVLETRTEEYVLARVRAGILEQSTVDVLTAAGLGDRLAAEGLVHRGVYLQFPHERHHLDFVDLVGRCVTAYGQTEVQKDLVAAARAAGREVHYGVTDVELHDLTSGRPCVSWVDADGTRRRVAADAVAGCDGSFGPSRAAVPADVARTWQRDYPFAWLGVLADVPPSTDELIYAWHPDGFALHSMRSTTVSRLYLQVPAGERVEDWSDDRVWDALATRLGEGQDGWHLTPGPITEKSVLPMRSFVRTPMRHGRLFLAGDAAHVVPPTGAKGLNLAVADVAVLAPALADLVHGDATLADAYSDTALARVWRATHFAWWMTTMLHTHGDDFDAQLQLARLREVVSTRSAAALLAENYAGPPLTAAV